MSRMPTFFLNHGGGPWPWMDGPMRQGYDQLEASLNGLLPSLGQMPKAVLVVSSHWEEAEPRVSSHPNPPMLYDYYGFPEHTYHVADEQRHDPGGTGSRCQPPALDAGEMAANGVDLADRSATVEQRARHRLLPGKIQSLHRKRERG